MNRKIILVTLLAALGSPLVFSRDVLSAPDTSVTSVSAGNARFEFLTPTLVRMEYSPHHAFVDVPTAIVLKRDWSPVNVKVAYEQGWLVAKTGKLTLRYRQDSTGFTHENLKILWADDISMHSWAPGEVDRLNLGGLAHSLDGAKRGQFPKIEPGILSRSGYFFLDDSRSPLEDSARQWIVPRTGEGNADLYLFVYGRDFHHVLKEYAMLCGQIPMIPRYALGTWITDLNYEYLEGSDMVVKHHYSDTNIKEVVDRFRREEIPLDVLVLDFAWHKLGWQGGYDWSPIIPDPKGFLGWAHARGLKVSLNDHPGYGNESVLSDKDSHAGEIRNLLQMPIPTPPTMSIDLLSDWKFRLDSAGAGVAKGWYSPSVDESGWQTIQAGKVWEEQGFPDYDGYAWYRKKIVVPNSGGTKRLYLSFGGVDDEYDLYVNGTKVAHYGEPGASVYNSVTSTEISSFLRPTGENVIALRVNDWGGGGGITKAPVTISDASPGKGIRFNLADKKQATAFMDVLHNPIIDQGVDFWWVDGGSGSCQMEGLSSQLWTNRVFYDFTEQHTGKRSLIFSRYGGWGDHRTPMFFTGDTHSEWDVLAYEVPFTARGGNVLAPYITHDIGGFLGKKLDLDLYTRWVQFGVMSPVMRLHCAHENPEAGNLRLPWIYGDEGVAIVKEMVRLRYKLMPYIYTSCREAYDDALPLVRPLYLEYPELDEAYTHPDEYLFGRNILVAPILDQTGARDLYLPPGEWIDYFTGEQHEGGRSIHQSSSLHTFPMFVRKGAVIPGEPVVQSTEQRTDTLTLDVFGMGSSTFDLYEDDGISFGYRTGKCAWTPLVVVPVEKSGLRLSVGPTKGSYDGEKESRAYLMHVRNVGKPKAVTSSIDGKKTANVRWSWDEHSRLLTIEQSPTSLRSRVELTVE